jgi:putative ABC transport system ATP-binding protein
MNTSGSENFESALKAQQLSKQVSSPEGMLTILDNVSLDVQHGESIAIVGASGAGKSTLLGLLAGLDVPSEGKIWLGSEEITSLDEDGRAALRADRVGFVFQSFHLISSLTALENVMLPLELAGAGNAHQAALQAIRAFVVEPSVLFADEPTGNLDNRTGDTVVDLLFKMNGEANTTLVLVTHDLSLAARCDRIFHMDAGRIEREESIG